MVIKDFEHLRIKHNQTINLLDYDSRIPAGEADVDEGALVQGVQKMGDKLDKLQTLLYAGKERGLLLVLQGHGHCR